MPVVPKEIMAQVDKIVTNSPNKVFCVTHIKHPLLLKSYGATLPEKYNNVKEEITFKQDLRHYFALRLQHRRYPVELYEFGKRLF